VARLGETAGRIATVAVRGHCQRDHRLTAENLRVTCRECNREGQRLRQRVARVQLVIEHHRAECPSCGARGACTQYVELLVRLTARKRALDAWRELGGRHLVEAL